jgi:hypothetical protein
MRLGMAVADEKRDATGDDPRLAGTGAGQNQQRSVRVENSVALFGIERVEELQ